MNQIWRRFRLCAVDFMDIDQQMAYAHMLALTQVEMAKSGFILMKPC